MSQVTSDLETAKNLENKGWTLIEFENAFHLWPPGMVIPEKYKVFQESKKQVNPNQPQSKADVIRVLLKEGKTKKETIDLMLIKFPECSKVSISSQVYTIANKM